MRLSHGDHTGEEGICLMEAASLLLARKAVRDGVVMPDYLTYDKTDDPRCIAYGVVRAARNANDLMPEDELWRLAPLLPRLLRARRCNDQELEERVTLRLSIWAARSVLHLVDPRLRRRCEAAIERAERELWGPTHEPVDDRHWAAGWNDAANAALLCGGGFVSNEMWAVVNALDPDEIPMWLSDLLDQHAKALAEEGQLAWDPEADYPPDDEIDAVVQAILASRC